MVAENEGKNEAPADSPTSVLEDEVLSLSLSLARFYETEIEHM